MNEMTLTTMTRQIQAAKGEIKAQLVLKNARILNVFTEQLEEGDIAIQDQMIVGIGEYSGQKEVDLAGKVVAPGFVDGHVHLESSVVSPKEYARAVVPHGTAAVVADPHEIANVLGVKGIEYLLETTKNLPMSVYFTASSCVPATCFDEAGATISEEDVKELLKKDRVLGLAEMMNYPGVLFADRSVLSKILEAKRAGKVLDGHAPGVTGKELNAYLVTGIRSDHESLNLAEAKEQISKGEYVMIREGTASKKVLEFLPLFEKPYSSRALLVTDDKHPGELKTNGHIDDMVRKAIANGADPIQAYKMGSFNTANYFGLKENGAIAPGYRADFMVLEDFEQVKIHSVYYEGVRVDHCLEELLSKAGEHQVDLSAICNTVNLSPVTAENFALKKEKEKVVGLIPNELLTTDEGYATQMDLEQDICKFSVIERHHQTGHLGVAFLKGYGLKEGAIATTIAHDSHNLIVAGANEEDMAFAVNTLRELQGGMVVVKEKQVLAQVALPIAGLMCDMEADECEEAMNKANQMAHQLGVHENIAPFMTLSFSSLPVIPTLRLTTKGVVDVTKFELLED